MGGPVLGADAEGDPAPPFPTSPFPTWRIVLVDDHAMVRAGLRALLDDDPRCTVVGEAGTAVQMLDLVARTTPDLVVLDLTLGTQNGLDALPDLVAGPSAPRVIVLTMHADPAFAREALRRGAQGYVLKEAAAEELLRAVEVVMAGSTFLDPVLGARMARAVPRPEDRLTERERQVLRLLAQGLTNAEIGKALHISLRTVEAHRAGLRTRLDVDSRAGLVAAARRLGLLA